MESNTEKVISKSCSNQLKGIASIMIVIHHYVHLSGIVGGIVAYIISAHFGYISVSLFFLLSAYGLTESESMKNSSFLFFIKRRLLKIYKPFIIINIITIFIYLLIGHMQFTLLSAGKYLIGIKLIDPLLWYIIVSMMLYVFFWISFQFKKDIYKVIILTLLCVAYMLVGHFYMKLPGNIYVSVLSFPIGMACSLYAAQIVAVLKSNRFIIYYLLYIVLDISLFFVFHKLGFQILKTIVLSFMLIPTYLFISYRNILKSKIFMFLGNISYETYLVHNKVFILMGIYIINYRNFPIFLIIVLLVALSFNYLLSALDFKKSTKSPVITTPI